MVEDMCLKMKSTRKADVRLPRKENSNFHGAKPVHQTISMIKWIRNSRLSITNSLIEDSGLRHTRSCTAIVEDMCVKGGNTRKVDVRLPGKENSRVRGSGV